MRYFYALLSITTAVLVAVKPAEAGLAIVATALMVGGIMALLPD